MIEPVKRYSSRVTISLAVAGLHLNVAQLAGDTLFLRETADVEPCPAELIITIDQKVVRETIILPRGISKGVTEVDFF